MRAEIYRRPDKRWDWRLKGANGEIIATSGGQAFNERNDAKEAADRVLAASFDEDFVLAYVEDTQTEPETT